MDQSRRRLIQGLGGGGIATAMGVTRLAGLSGLAAGLAGRPSSAAADQAGKPTAAWEQALPLDTPLTASPASIQLAPAEYAETPVWAYNGTVPGPLLRYRQGETLNRLLINDLPQPSTIHWHGLRLPNGMDGVPNMTQAPVEAGGGQFRYVFDLPDAGTYWYHPHAKSEEQVGRGLYGPLIIDEKDQAGWAQEAGVEDDQILILDDWRLTQTAALSEPFGNRHDRSHGGRIGNWVTANGVAEWRYPVRAGQRFRLRLINTANARIFSLQSLGLNAWIVALDGMPLTDPVATDQIALGPAQRVDLVIDITASAGEAMLISEERDGGYAVATFPVAESASAGRSGVDNRAKPAPLPANTVPAINDPTRAKTVDLLMQGGAMGGAANLTREMIDAGMFWTFNGRAHMQVEPLVEAERGEIVRVRMNNDTRWPHSMHLHGHHFQKVEGERLGPLRDTILMQPGEAFDIAFVADNPGDWMFHCHMLGHQAAGMMTWVRVKSR